MLWSTITTMSADCCLILMHAEFVQQLFLFAILNNYLYAMFLLVTFKHVCNMFNFLISRVHQFLLFDILSHLSTIDLGCLSNLNIKSKKNNLTNQMQAMPKRSRSTTYLLAQFCYCFFPFMERATRNPLYTHNSILYSKLGVIFKLISIIVS